MIFKYLLLSILLTQSLFVFSQNNIQNDKKHIYFDVNNFPVFKIDSINDEQIIKYYVIEEQKASKNVRFEGGYVSLSLFCDSLYFNRKDYNYDELNAKAIYAIFFDKHLKIAEIRILKRIGYENYNYDDLVKEILFSTEGRWIKTTDDNSDWFFYFGYFNLR